jgi:hypothetical protein
VSTTYRCSELPETPNDTTKDPKTGEFQLLFPQFISLL